MMIIKTDRENSIRMLENFAVSLNGGRVKHSIYKKISEVFQLLKSTTNEVRYIEVAECETDTLLAEFLAYLSARKNLLAIVYLGRNSSVYARGTIEKSLKNIEKVYIFPTNYATNKIIINVSFLSESSRELYDIDYAMNILRDYDR